MKKSKVEIFFDDVLDLTRTTREVINEFSQEIDTALDKYNKILKVKTRVKIKEQTESRKRLEYNAKRYKNLLIELRKLKLHIESDIEELIQSQLIKIDTWKEASSFVKNFPTGQRYEALDMIKSLIHSLYYMPLDNEKELPDGN